jgi:hypothetical protein
VKGTALISEKSVISVASGSKSMKEKVCSSDSSVICIVSVFEIMEGYQVLRNVGNLITTASENLEEKEVGNIL